MPVEDAKPVVLFTAEEETEFLRACDERQFPVFLTPILTGHELELGMMSYLTAGLWLPGQCSGLSHRPYSSRWTSDDAWMEIGAR